MGCSVEEALNEALRDCGACVSVGAQRNWVLLQRADQTYAAPNNPTTMVLSASPTDAQGRVAHVRALAFVGLVNATTQAGNAAVSAYNLRGAVYRQLQLQDVTGWNFIQGFDARTVLDEIFFRHYGKRAGFIGREHSAGAAGQPRMPVIGQDEGIPSLGVLTTANYDCSFVWPFTRLDAEGNPLEGLVTLASLQQAIAGGGLQLRFGATADLPGTPVGVAINNYVRYDGSQGIDLWADIVYLPAVVADPPWNISHGVMQQQDGNLPFSDRLWESVTLRYLPEDAAALAGQALAQQCTGLTFTVGKNTFMSGMTNLDASTRMALFYGSSPYGGAVTDNAALDLPLWDGAPQNIALPLALQILPFAPRELAASGTLSVLASTRTPTFWRWLTRTIKCPNSKYVSERAAQLYRTAQCGPCGGIFATDPRGVKTNKMGFRRPLIMQPSKFMQRRA